MKYLFFVCMATCMAYSQNTIRFKPTDKSPEAKISDIGWMAGSWQGNALGGQCEEIWSKPAAGSMMFSFRLIINSQVTFYELGHVIEKDGSLLLQLKHFEGNLKGWEEPYETVDFPLVKLEKNKAWFDGFTIEQKAPGHVVMYVLMEDSGKELVFDYTKEP